MNIKELIFRDFGVSLPLESGSGKRNDPFRLVSADQWSYLLHQFQLINCISLGRRIYWRVAGKEIITEDNLVLEKLSIETIELTEAQKVTQTEAYFFKEDENGRLGHPSLNVPMPTPHEKLSLPFEIGWLHFRYFTDYSGTNPELGFATAYSAPNVEATIYVYNNGLEQVPSDLNAEIVGAEFFKVNSGILAQNAGLEAWPDVINDGTHIFKMYKADPEGLRVTGVSLTTSNDHFVKVRISWLRDYDIDRISIGFVESVAAMFRASMAH